MAGPPPRSKTERLKIYKNGFAFASQTSSGSHAGYESGEVDFCIVLADSEPFIVYCIVTKY